jgi:hypothetical protein
MDLAHNVKIAARKIQQKRELIMDIEMKILNITIYILFGGG